MASIDQIQISSGSSSATYDIDAKTVNGKTVESNVPPSAKFTDTKVVQTPTTADGDYRVIFSGTEDDTSHTEQVRKNGNFTYNPDSTALKITKQFSSGGVTGTRITTHAGYGLNIEEYVGSTLWSGLGLRSGDITLTNKTWDGTNASLATAISAIKQSLSDYIKIKSVLVPKANLATNMDLSSYVSLDSSYKFLCWLVSGASNGWITTMPIYISVPGDVKGRPFWHPSLTIGGAVNFYYFEIKDV